MAEVHIGLCWPGPNWELCPVCAGTGKAWAMQALMTRDGRSIRGPDIRVTCTRCNGRGYIERRQ